MRAYKVCEGAFEEGGDDALPPEVGGGGGGSTTRGPKGSERKRGGVRGPYALPGHFDKVGTRSGR